jgi:hypothetical protein
MNNRADNRREAGLKLISNATRVMAVGAIGLTGSVALLADHIYNVQHAGKASQRVSSSAASSTNSLTSGDDGSALTSASQAPSASSQSSSSSGSTAIVSGGS